MIDLKEWDAQDTRFRNEVRCYTGPRDRILSNICCHYEFENDEFFSADQKAQRFLDDCKRRPVTESFIRR